MTQVVDSKVLNFGYVAGRAEASANIIESGAVLPAKHPFCFWAVPISEQPAGHEGSVRGMINRDDSALAVFCVVALKGESPDLEVDA